MKHLSVFSSVKHTSLFYEKV